ncbi:hypothetical protein S7711_06422 [Stachybotrys chartarum IBT 7711]|uniref:ubiquitinyl hydrolase 1 n=1 Tax=Stachybotrys chartarum (strain CBS 109288 / IBT 7711) TaxID=1280523 RepID=A0A084AX37_STACB|nr:hypothetical protein S7711_06422 [Stachybotrys chartarum IBT 7711]
MKEFPRKFLSLRDKNGAHRRSKSVPPGTKKEDHVAKFLSLFKQSRPTGADGLMSIFKTDHSKPSLKDENEKENGDPLIEGVQRRLEELNITGITPEHIRTILATEFAQGDPKKTAEFIDIEQKAFAGVVMPYDPNIHMLGAENRAGVTCYLDALLFAMFCKLDAYECMLQADFPPDDHRRRLVELLRIWVNMLRTGKLIRTDMTKVLQDTLADCGWSDARMLEQQDTSEAFGFLTETLQLPLLSLQVDLFHQGKNDVDDHKVVYERLLNLAVPPDPEGKGIKLEDCLEEYFNTQVDVSRDSEEGKKALLDDNRRDSAASLSQRSTLRLVTSHDEDGTNTVTASPATLTPTPISRPLGSKEDGLAASPLATVHSASTIDTSTSDAAPSQESYDAPLAGEDPPSARQDGELDHVPSLQDTGGASSSAAPRPTNRHRSTSIIQRVMIDEQGRTTSTDESTFIRRARQKGSTIVKAVTIPAWQFFRLIPWHSVSSNEPRSNLEVALNFDQRPVVGICLKRYLMTETGVPKRHNTFIDIPDSMRLPHFMLAGEGGDEESKDLNTGYKLVLQSVVCHRGDSLQSGHYIAFARVAPKLLTDNRRHDFDPPPDYEEAQWVRFDDLDVNERVSYVDDIREALKAEMPYLLFYQVVPTMNAKCPSVEGTEVEPPSYNESRASLDYSRTPSLADLVDAKQAVRQKEGYFDNIPATEATVPLQSGPPSIRLSMEMDRPPSRGIETANPASHTGSATVDSKRQGPNAADSALPTPAITPDGHSPAITPVDESTASRLSRAANRFSRGRQSRPASQSGENRLSMSGITRLSTLIRTSKEHLNDPNSISVTTLNSAPQAADETTTNESTAGESPVDSEKPALPSAHKHGHKRLRSKEKTGKNQPERECSVM